MPFDVVEPVHDAGYAQRELHRASGMGSEVASRQPPEGGQHDTWVDMLSYVKTTLFESPAQTLVNTVNTVGVMGKGVAAEFKRRYPEMFKKYREFCRSGELDIGKLWLYRTPNKWVLNFPTKKHWRDPSKLEYVEAGLKKFVASYTDQGVTSISFPLLGCGNGGLPWPQVQSLMERYLKQPAIPVYVHVTAMPKEFVPEHLSVEARAQASSTRQSISFARFWRDLHSLIGVVQGSELALGAEADEEPAVESIPLELRRGHPVEVPRVVLEDLWNGLRLRGGLRLEELPGGLREYADCLEEMLLRLEYIEPLRFAAGPRANARAVRGLRFAPKAEEQESGTPVEAL
jgi:O-acetyl-ADP-ribose deacetylase (regulator of RNase III)